MIHRTDFVEIGYLKKLIGVDGTFLLKLRVKQTNKWFLTKKEPIFIEIDGNLVPFFLDNIKQDESEPVIHFDCILNRENAAEFLERKCFYDKKHLTTTDKVQNVENLIGYTLIDKASVLEAIITNINSIPGNPLIEIIYKEKHFDIPFIESAIQNIDSKKQIIYTNYPNGLLQSLLEMN